MSYLSDLNDSQHLQLWRAPQQNLKCSFIYSTHITILQKERENDYKSNPEDLFLKKQNNSNSSLSAFIYIISRTYEQNNMLPTKQVWLKSALLYLLGKAKHCHQVAFHAWAHIFQAESDKDWYSSLSIPLPGFSLERPVLLVVGRWYWWFFF